MAYPAPADSAPGSLFNSQPPSFAPPPPTPRDENAPFDLLQWYPSYASCQRYFLDHAQHQGPVQAVAAFLNILLPYQRNPPTYNSIVVPRAQSSAAQLNSNTPFSPALSTSLIPYLRRLVVTGIDFPGILHGFFGDDWASGIGPLHEQERRNYLFAAKSGGWAAVKRDYDMEPLQTVPFLRPLQAVAEQEVVAAEKSWSEFMAFEDWMVGPRAPEGKQEDGGQVDGK